MLSPAVRRMDVQQMVLKPDCDLTPEELLAVAITEETHTNLMVTRIERQMGIPATKVGCIQKHVEGAQAIEWHLVPWVAPIE